jgi:teichoic acid transport system permease protein
MSKRYEETAMSKDKDSVLKSIVELPTEVYKDRKMIMTLAKNDFKTKFAGSYLGIIWAFIQPVVTVLTYWFIFQVGFRSGRISDYPYVIWLVAGIVPWFFFSDAISGGTNAMIEYSYLVKKVVFNIDVLPVVKMISALFVHLFFVLFVIVLSWAYGYPPDVYDLQLIYYMLFNFLFALGLVYMTSALVVFFRDLSPLIGIILQVGIWFAPIMWDAENMLPAKLLFVFKLNPMFYIVSGFRDCLLKKVWFVERGWWNLYYWAVIIVICLLGTAVFKRLKVHFADVL